MNRVLINTLFLSLLAGCASSPSLDANNSAGKAASFNSTAAQGNAASAQGDHEKTLAQKRSVYFALDEYVVQDEGKRIVQSHAAYLARNADKKVRIEGNADEQGSREYNLALGQKRAHAVKTAMTLLGVKESQIETMSWGEERPAASGHTEEAWAKNRRADIQYADAK